ncbi:helicase-related protein, partial [Enterobacter hormaechei]
RKKIHQWYYRRDNLDHKVELLKHLLKQQEATRTIVFVRKRERVHELTEMLRNAGINNCYLEGEKAQVKRTEGVKHLAN